MLYTRYDRILDRLKYGLESKVKKYARKVLEWIGCAPRPLRATEIEHALAIRTGDTAIVYERLSFQNLLHLCGPIIEYQNEFIVYVHFTVKEYYYA